MSQLFLGKDTPFTCRRHVPTGEGNTDGSDVVGQVGRVPGDGAEGDFAEIEGEIICGGGSRGAGSRGEGGLRRAT